MTIVAKRSATKLAILRLSEDILRHVGQITFFLPDIQASSRSGDTSEPWIKFPHVSQ